MTVGAAFLFGAGVAFATAPAQSTEFYAPAMVNPAGNVFWGFPLVQRTPQGAHVPLEEDMGEFMFHWFAGVKRVVFFATARFRCTSMRDPASASG